MNLYNDEIAECRRRIALGASLNVLESSDPNFRTLITEGFLKSEVLARSLNINVDKSGTIRFLRSAADFKKYLDKVRSEADQAGQDLINYMNLIQDARNG